MLRPRIEHILLMWHGHQPYLDCRRYHTIDQRDKEEPCYQVLKQVVTMQGHCSHPGLITAPTNQEHVARIYALVETGFMGNPSSTEPESHESSAACPTDQRHMESTSLFEQSPRLAGRKKQQRHHPGLALKPGPLEDLVHPPLQDGWKTPTKTGVRRAPQHSNQVAVSATVVRHPSEEVGRNTVDLGSSPPPSSGKTPPEDLVPPPL